METKGQFNERIKAEGRWQEYLDLRSLYVEKEGMKPADAGKRARAEMPPLPAGTAIADSSPASATTRAAAAGQVAPSLTADDIVKKPAASAAATLKWVAENLHNADATIDTAPSGAAYSLLMDCRANPGIRQGFWLQMYTKIIPSQKELEKDNIFGDEGDDDIMRLLDKHDDIINRRAAAKLAETKPDPVPVSDSTDAPKPVQERPKL